MVKRTFILSAPLFQGFETEIEVARDDTDIKIISKVISRLVITLEVLHLTELSVKANGMKWFIHDWSPVLFEHIMNEPSEKIYICSL